ncbi:uncharacterized protein LOC120013407 [Tripterygium wilfordii]|uniref:uncharacterized protein LOC120013407 n=1 Tax=Tripterygium wilfordii TaxID=458696 RepID=UPI0018F849AD|nr:uncharacterized protein LOC120013407 [Tripterygium wilfordii]
MAGVTDEINCRFKLTVTFTLETGNFSNYSQVENRIRRLYHFLQNPDLRTRGQATNAVLRQQNIEIKAMMRGGLTQHLYDGKLHDMVDSDNNLTWSEFQVEPVNFEVCSTDKDEDET